VFLATTICLKAACFKPLAGLSFHHMWRVFVNEQLKQHPRVGPWYVRAQRYGVWPFACALAAASVVVIIPLFLLIIAGTLVGMVVYIIASLVVWIITSVQDFWDRIRGANPDAGMDAPPPDNSGRENVRVID
jgi:hypothetical protein